MVPRSFPGPGYGGSVSRIRRVHRANAVQWPVGTVRMPFSKLSIPRSSRTVSAANIQSLCIT